MAALSPFSQVNRSARDAQALAREGHRIAAQIALQRFRVRPAITSLVGAEGSSSSPLRLAMRAQRRGLLSRRDVAVGIVDRPVVGGARGVVWKAAACG